MIYVGLRKQFTNQRMAYSISAEVFTTEKEMYKRIFEDQCTIVMLTDDFIRNEIHWSTVSSLLSQLRLVKPIFKFVIVGTEIEIETNEAHILRQSWDNAAQTLDAVEKVALQELHPSAQLKNNILDLLRYNLQEPDFLISMILRNPELVLPELRRIVNDEVGSVSKINRLSSSLDTVVLENSKLKSAIEKRDKDIERITRRYQELAAKHEALLAKINKQYELAYDENNSNGFHISVCRYAKILYVKEITRIHFVDTLLYYLQCILNTLNDQPTRYCIIEKEYSYTSSRLYPHHLVHSSISYSELKTRDICMVGYQKDILGSILQNPSNAKYLILLDRSGHDFAAVFGDRVRTLYTLSDLTDNKYFHIPADITISYSDSTFYIPTIPGFDDMPDTDKLKAYSSLEITKALLNVIEGSDI